MIGTGYVGLVSGTCISDFGLNVTCVDKDEKKINKLKNGELPIYEPGLKDLVDRNVYYKRLSFTTSVQKAVEENDVIFIAVGTPPAEDGSADLQYVLQVARDIGAYMNGYKVIVDKSTVPVGTGQKVKSAIKEVLSERGLDFKFDVVSNPEFLREGSAIQDFTHADRVVLGAESDKAIEIMKQVYRVLYLNETPFLVTNIETAELVKYSSNAFLATKISFINELSELCEKVGANIQHISKGMGMDGRIGSKFLHAGPGYGGSCFPKDTQALVKIAKDYDCKLGIVSSTIEANNRQKLRMVDKILQAMGEVEGKTFGILGLAFKNNTDDMRESTSITIINELAKRGAKFKVYDPKAMEEARWRLKNVIDVIDFCNDEYEAALETDGLVIITEWNQFRSLDLDKIKECMRGNCFFDLRNIYPRDIVENKGFKYYCVGR
ncbi:UDP-glucose dehydrogenase family protein [Clostridium hydrogenum]|uniref:UDP-glucose dehydrogenase family protein n=1 Tax=Clostridium hydrogenum TaxID=2855764 RepID=UPI001F2F9BAE